MLQTTQQTSINDVVKAFANLVAEIVIDSMRKQLTGAQEEKTMTRQEVMDMLHITDATMWRWEKTGVLKRSGKLGGRVYYKTSDVMAALENSKKH